MKLALLGGEKTRQNPIAKWPVFDESEQANLQRALESGKWGALHGDEVAQCEQEFARLQQVSHALAVTSGTIALEIALGAIDIQAGDEVILPGYTFVASATAVLRQAAVPVFVDIDPGTYNIDPEKIEAAITPQTRAIMPVHFAGRPADMDAICAIAERHELKIIEDAAQAWGATWREKGLGEFGDVGCFSFQSSKNITAGEGGMLTSHSAEVAARARSLANCGRDPDGLWYAHYVLAGNHRMTEFQGAVLRAQLARYRQQLAQRQKMSSLLAKKLSSRPGITTLRDDPRITSHAWHLFIFEYDAEAFDGLPKATFVEALQAEGIPCSGGYSIPLYEQPMFQKRAFGPFSSLLAERVRTENLHLPNVHKACYERAIWLPQFVLLGNAEAMRDIDDAIDKIFASRQELLSHAQR